jgi:phosphatidate phosphatase LPIN
LFDAINTNGYRTVYLSARASCQFDSTKSMLKVVGQIGNKSATSCSLMPQGPVLLNPASLIDAFQLELVEKCSERFKIQCLAELKELFESNPFFAAFGNKQNDLHAYETVGLDNSNIFIINESSFINTSADLTYAKILSQIDSYFPKIK